MARWNTPPSGPMRCASLKRSRACCVTLTSRLDITTCQHSTRFQTLHKRVGKQPLHIYVGEGHALRLPLTTCQQQALELTIQS